MLCSADWVLIFGRLLGCSAYRQIARELRVSPTTVLRQTVRLGRHCLLLHETLRPHAVPREPDRRQCEQRYRWIRRGAAWRRKRPVFRKRQPCGS